MKKLRSSIAGGPLLGYHGCDRGVAERILAGEDELNESSANHDWLGPGVYFWVDSPALAFGWACHVNATRPKTIRAPYVIGAYINPGLCLNLTDLAITRELQRTYKEWETIVKIAGKQLPSNEMDPDSGEFVNRQRDCAFLQFIHATRATAGLPAYDSVLGVFESNPPVFPGSAMKLRTHIQIAVRSHNEHSNILGYFRVPQMNEMVADWNDRKKKRR